MKTAVLLKNGVVLIDSVELAVDLKSRMIGLLGRSSLGKQRAMHISPCGSIHTFFMKFNLDLFFLNRGMQVLKIVRNVAPGRIVPGGWGAHSVIELESGWFSFDALHVGDQVNFHNKDS